MMLTQAPTDLVDLHDVADDVDAVDRLDAALVGFRLAACVVLSPGMSGGVGRPSFSAGPIAVSSSSPRS